MRKIFILIIFSLFVLVGCSSSQQRVGIDINKEPASEIPKLLTEGKISVNVMELGLPPKLKNEAERITKKLQEAAQRNPNWYTQYVAKSQPGKELPYHPNLGISEKEYKDFLSFSTQMKLIKAGTGTIEIRKNANKITLKALQNLKLLNDIEIDLDKNIVRTAYGICTPSSKIIASNDQIATGRWNSYSWKLEEGQVPSSGIIDNTTNIKIVGLHIGQIEKTNETMIYIKVQQMINGKVAVDNSEQITF